MKQQTWLKWIAVASSVGMLCILLGGALVTKTDSGLGCGRNWPDCNGSLIPKEITAEVLIEFSHRAVTAFVSIFIVLLAVACWRKLGHIREVKFLSAVSVIFLFTQALIGAAQVKWGQGDFILALHFGISLISFASVLLLTLIVFEVDRKFDADHVKVTKKLRRQTIAVTLYSYIAIYTGALVRHTESSLACLDWPVCHFERGWNLLPANQYEWIQMGHRFAVLILIIWIFSIAIHVIRHERQQKALLYTWVGAACLVGAQMITGMLVVLTRLQLFVALGHSLFISMLFGLLCYSVMLVSRSTEVTKPETVASLEKNVYLEESEASSFNK
ncbi:COX15/CtaA family protein [Caryophanon tenue]|uniref:Heme A synthase n=1 Tax=Caryophanon tenue TaxID=33978 RepID=A0A1C0YK56_9BACL|nr:heme A synthase [Caryophanon tenue]OCS87558.1 heme A synthase [Caryophanon tenue]